MAEADNKQFVIVDLATWERMMDGLRQGLAMANDKYPHLTSEYEFTIEMAKKDAESFTGKQNKPQTKPTYNEH